MHDADNNGAEGLIEFELAESSIEPSLRRRLFTVAIALRIVTMNVAMNIVAMAVRMNMLEFTFRFLARAEGFVYPAHDAPQIQESQDNQHQGHDELQGETGAGGNYDAENDPPTADQQDREGMANPPKHSDQCRTAHRTLPADNGGHCDHMIRVHGNVRDYRCRMGRSGPATEEHSGVNGIVLMRYGAFCQHFGRRNVCCDDCANKAKESPAKYAGSTA